MTKENKFSFIRETAQFHETYKIGSRKKRSPRNSRKAVQTTPDVAKLLIEQARAARRRARKAAREALEAEQRSLEQQPEQPPTPEAAPQSKKVGRPKGKRSNPDYEQVTAYIRRETHSAIKNALLQDGKKREFSELIEDLLTKHLQKSPKTRR